MGVCANIKEREEELISYQFWGISFKRELFEIKCVGYGEKI